MTEDELNRRDHNRSLYREHIENCAVCAKELLIGSFILNGVAVTAIMASNKFEELMTAVLFFALGTLFVLVSGLFVYFYQTDIAFTYKYHVTGDPEDLPKKTREEYEQMKIPALIFGGTSLILFAIGLAICACRLG